jgi:hypothetical protein
MNLKRDKVKIHQIRKVIVEIENELETALNTKW